MAKDRFSKLSKAVDAFADALTEDVSSTKRVSLYRYSDLVSFVSKIKKSFPAVNMCTVSLTAQNEFNGVVFPEKKYIIRVLFQNKNGQPVCFDRKSDDYVGTVIIASSVDDTLSQFMKGMTERTVAVRGEM